MTVEKKYELTDETIQVDGKTLHRIRALRDFGDAKKGYLGGFIEHEGNLSHVGDCWGWHTAKVFGKARVYGRAIVYGYAKVYGNACVGHNAHIFGNACVYGDAHVYDDAYVYGTAVVYEFARVFGNACISKDCLRSVARVDGSERKYAFTGEETKINGFTLKRIRALKDFGDVKKGDLGGWVESEENLSHEGNCWISSEGAVSGGVRIRGDEQIIDFQHVSNTITYKTSPYETFLLTPQQYMKSLPWHRRIWERLCYYWEFKIWL